MAYWGVYYRDPKTGAHVPCESDGGIFYDAYPDRDMALRSAARSNDNYAGTYVVRLVPAGTLVYNYLTDQTERAA